jgi:hypothetical protein
MEGFADDPSTIEKSPPGAEGDEELFLLAENSGLVSLLSVDGTAGDFPKADEGLWGKSATQNLEPNREAVAHHWPG